MAVVSKPGVSKPRSRGDRAAELVRRARPRTTPGAVRALLLISVLAVVGLFLVVNVAADNARFAVQRIGHEAGPQVMATADLYLALSDMDAQVADIVLIGREDELGAGRDAALERYQQRRVDANAAILHVADLTGGDPTERATIRAVLDGLGRYEQLAAEAMVLNRQSAHPAGPPPAEVLELYRQATDLMRLELLPKAYNLTLESGTIVRRTYEDKQAAVRLGRLWIGLAGLAAVGILVGLQVFVARRFRRRINPALAAATLVTVLLTVAAGTLLTGLSGQLRMAKEEGFDAILSLTRARAISTSMHADQSRYLLDPARADTYEQVYFAKSQSLVYVPVGQLRSYYGEVAQIAEAYRAGRRPTRFLGLLGEEARVAAETGGPSLRPVLLSYHRFQADDRRMRAQASGGDTGAAVALQLGRKESFTAYDQALRALIRTHRHVFDDAVAAADDRLDGWRVLPAVLTPVAAVLIVIGVWPRLREYR